MEQYFDKIVRGTESEDNKMIVQLLRTKIGKKFQFLNYYKEIPVSYDALLVAVDNEMAEFELHEYQAKIIALEKKALIYSPDGSDVPEDIFAEAFYINSLKKKAILCKFGYAKIRSDMRRFVRVTLDRPIEAEIITEGDTKNGNVKDLSIGGALVYVEDQSSLELGEDIEISLKLPDLSGRSSITVLVNASIVKVLGEEPPFGVVLQFYPEKHSQQHISYYVNQRQVEIIKELKDIVT